MSTAWEGLWTCVVSQKARLHWEPRLVSHLLNTVCARKRAQIHLPIRVTNGITQRWQPRRAGPSAESDHSLALGCSLLPVTREEETLGVTHYLNLTRRRGIQTFSACVSALTCSCRGHATATGRFPREVRYPPHICWGPSRAPAFFGHYL